MANRKRLDARAETFGSSSAAELFLLTSPFIEELFKDFAHFLAAGFDIEGARPKPTAALLTKRRLPPRNRTKRTPIGHSRHPGRDDETICGDGWV